MPQIVALKFSKNDISRFASVDKTGEIITDRTGSIEYEPAAVYFNSECLIQLSSTDKVVSGNTYCINMSAYTDANMITFNFETIELLIGGVVDDFVKQNVGNSDDVLDGEDFSDYITGGTLLTVSNYDTLLSLIAQKGYFLFDYTGSATISVY